MLLPISPVLYRLLVQLIAQTEQATVALVIRQAAAGARIAPTLSDKQAAEQRARNFALQWVVTERGAGQDAG